MALIKCKECGHEISDKATSCPNCGAPLSKVQQQNVGCAQVMGAGFLVLIAIVTIGAIFSDDSDKKSDSATTQTECAKTDLQCLGNKGVIAAGVYCVEPIEKLAIHDVKWTDGTFDFKFSKFAWKDETKGVITYFGDKAEFQNGFGAYTPVTYACDLAPDNQTVLDVRIVSEGRMDQ